MLHPKEDVLSLIESRLDRYQPRTICHERPQAGVLLALTDDPIDPRVILTLRAHTLSSHQGEVAFPGGKMDKGDLSIEVTALREAHEEIGLHPSDVRVVSQLAQCVSKHGLLVTPFVGIVSDQQEFVANPDELHSVFSVPLRFFLDPDELSYDEFHHQGALMRMPCYHYQQYRIWGLTAYILVELLNYGLGAKIPLQSRPKMNNKEG
ncbi:MAG: CoA pyrophosphatase [Motiliproteus sp.]